jgi:hypothetical protein
MRVLKNSCASAASAACASAASAARAVRSLCVAAVLVLVRVGLVRAGLVRAGLVRVGLVRAGLVRVGLVRVGLVRVGLGLSRARESAASLPSVRVGGCVRLNVLLLFGLFEIACAAVDSICWCLRSLFASPLVASNSCCFCCCCACSCRVSSFSRRSKTENALRRRALDCSRSRGASSRCGRSRCRAACRRILFGLLRVAAVALALLRALVVPLLLVRSRAAPRCAAASRALSLCRCFGVALVSLCLRLSVSRCPSCFFFSSARAASPLLALGFGVWGLGFVLVYAPLSVPPVAAVFLCPPARAKN